MIDKHGPISSSWLEDAWHRLAGPYHCRATRSAFYQGIVNRYSAPGRHYHTLRHVAEVLQVIEQHRHQLDNYEAVEFAAWFHDIVYDPGSRENEEQSARLALRTLRRLQVPSRIADRVRQLILMTADHTTTDSTFDAQLFLDADLAILGSPPEQYARYLAGIRREYSSVDDAGWSRGREKFLKELLSRERVFQTEILSEQFEAEARMNMTAELESLLQVNQ